MHQVEDLGKASFCESVEAGHSSHGQQAAIAKALGITRESVRMDSQAKYASIARGDGDVYLRLPTSKTYQEKIWVCPPVVEVGVENGMLNRNRTMQPESCSWRRPAGSLPTPTESRWTLDAGAR